MKKLKRNVYSVEWQMKRYNLSKEEAEKKVEELKRKKSNPYSIEYQMKRYNLNEEEAKEKITNLKKKTTTGHLIADPKWQMKRFGLSEEEAKKKVKDAYERRRNSYMKIKEEDPERFKSFRVTHELYWIKKGYSEEEAKKKAIEYQENMRRAFQENIKNNPQMYEARTETQLKYWINKGYTEEEAKEKLKERQRTFTLDKCIKKYGKEKGFDVWRKRHEEWSKKIEAKYRNGEFSKMCKHNYSNIELEFLEELLDKLNTNEKYYCALDNQKQFFRHFKENQQTYAYDFVMGKKIIEFNGDYWHCNPKIYEADYYHKMIKCTAKEKWEFDKTKKELIEKYGYKVMIVWEYDYRKNPEITINRCIEFLNN